MNLEPGGLANRRHWTKGPRWLVHSVAAALICLAFLVASVAQACTLPTDKRTDIPPNGLGQATTVTFAIVVADVMSIDDANQQMDIDFFVTVRWTDPRLLEYEGCRFTTTQVWFPQIRLLNSSNLRRLYLNNTNQVAVGAQGTVQYVQRFTGTISTYHNLRHFPFDAHQFKIEISADKSPNHLIDFVADNDQTWIRERLNIEGWDIGDVKLVVDPLGLRNVTLSPEKLTLIIPGARNPEFYVYRQISLLAIVVAMSWVIFWVPPSRFEFQIGLGATTMLTAIAFIFAISNRLPPVGYLTTLDRMVIWAIILILLSIIEALVAGRLVLSGKEETALRVDYVSRFLFPALLFGGWLVAISTGSALS